MTSSGDVFSRFARRLAPPPSSSSAPPLPSRGGLPSSRSADGGVSGQDGPAEDLGKVNKVIKDSKLKLQVAIRGEEIRVSGQKRDKLQDAIQMIKNMDIKQPLQFINFRD